MSSRSRANRRGRRSPLSPAAEQQGVAADELVSRLCALLPPDQAAAAAKAASTTTTRARVLREACVYIRRLHAELDGLAQRLARLLDDDPSAAVAVADGTDAGAGATTDDESSSARRNRLMM